MQSTIHVGDKKVRVLGDKKTLTTKMYGWSKYGGVSMGLVQENLTPEWYCQACNDKQTDDLPPYMFEFTPREFIRICSVCHFNRIKDNITVLSDLIDAVRIVH
jgi:hypothetical protein